MQAHPLSIPAARIPSLSLTQSPQWAASHLGLPPVPVLLLPASSALRPPPARSTAVSPAIPVLSGVFAEPVAEQAGLAHDAGNLLGALRLYSDLLRAPGVLRSEHQHYAAELGLIAARSSTLIRRLLLTGSLAISSSAQPDAAVAGESAPPRQCSPATVLRTLTPVLERIAAGAATVSLTTPATLPTVDLPTEALERIAVNLVRNAAEAIRSARRPHDAEATLHGEGPLPHGESGRIRLTLDVFGGALRFTVEDNGPGMPPAVAAAFLRPGAVPLQAGRGLGHRIVHELTEATGGKLSIRVRPGRGTALCVRWPLLGAGDGAAC